MAHHYSAFMATVAASLACIPCTLKAMPHQIPTNFFKNEGEYIYYGKTHVHDPAIANNEVGYAQVFRAQSSWNHMFNRKNGFKIGVGASGLKLDWQHNPITTRKLFGQAEFSLGLFTLDAKGWTIASEFMMSMDPAEMNFSHYTLYRGIIYTKYNYQDKFNIHAGFIGYYGLRYNRVVPIAGIDFSIGKYVKLNAVFPMNISLEVEPNRFLTLFARARFLQLPRRLQKTDPLPEGVMFYNSSGAEGGVKLHYFEYFNIQGFVGRTLSPHIKAETFDGAETTYYRMRSSTYFGASVLFYF